MKTSLPATIRSALIVLTLLAIPSLAHAHVGVGQTSGWLHGMSHPLSGLDHICAMIAVGLWASQMGGRSLWLVPLTFVAVMAFGGFLGMMGVSLPFVEQGIVVSVLTLGIFIVAAVRLPLVASMLLVGLFALCHGHAHGAEMPETVSGFLYAAGFVFATAFLHALGIGLGIAVQKFASPVGVRFAGLAIVLCGVCLL